MAGRRVRAIRALMRWATGLMTGIALVVLSFAIRDLEED